MSKLSNSDRAIIAQREWDIKGQPEKVAEINRLLAKGEEVPESLLNTSRVRPEANADSPEAYEAPPRKGTGSGKDNWVTFAATATDMEPDVLDAMSRDDIIELLEKRKVIEKES